MPAYRFLGISTNERGFVAADALIHGTDGKKTTFNHKLFEEVPVGTHFVMDRTKRYPDNPVVIIKEDNIPVILKQDEEDARAAKEAYEKKKAENIATGRFKYWYTDSKYNQSGKAENILETLTEDYDKFWEKLAEVINDGSRISGKPREVPLTVDQLKQESRYIKFMELAQPGDKLEWYSWNGGFLAYSAGPHITRGEECVAYMPWIVS
jgi:hypothetical protein